MTLDGVAIGIYLSEYYTHRQPGNATNTPQMHDVLIKGVTYVLLPDVDVFCFLVCVFVCPGLIAIVVLYFPSSRTLPSCCVRVYVCPCICVYCACVYVRVCVCMCSGVAAIAGELKCLPEAPCHGITLQDVHIVSPRGFIDCEYVHGSAQSVFPSTEKCLPA